MKKKKLTDKQARFKDLYLKYLNAVKAGKEAGFADSTANKVCPLWIGENRSSCPEKFLHVWDAIKEAQKELRKRVGIDQERVLKEEGRIAFFDPGLLFDLKKGSLLPPHKLPEDVRRAIASIEIVVRTIPGKDKKKEKETTYKYKFNDKGRSLERVSRHLGMYEKDNSQQATKIVIIPDSRVKKGKK